MQTPHTSAVHGPSRLGFAASLLALAALLGCPTAGDGPSHGPADDDASDDDDAADDDAADDDTPGDDDSQDDDDDLAGYPPFYTPNDDFFETHIGLVPHLDPASYTLTISGLVDQPTTFTLDELDALASVEVPLTLECIGNPVGGSAVDTAVWSGFSLYDLLDSLGLQPGATAVRYHAADGYYTWHSLDQIRDDGVIGALAMNGEALPERHGYPLRLVLPGYYGIKHPGWVTALEVIDHEAMDFWDAFGWDCAPPQDVDSGFFFPAGNSEHPAGAPIAVGGAAWGGGRVARVEVSADDGASWTDAEIVEQLDADHVWVFWAATVTVDEPGEATLRVRATDHAGVVQPQSDPDPFDGSNGWARRSLQIVN